MLLKEGGNMVTVDLDSGIPAEFSRQEQCFKYIFEHNWPCNEAVSRMNKDPYLSSVLSDAPDDALAVRRILERAGSESVLEDEEFFRDNEDVFMNMHSRYMPVYKHRHSFFELQYVLRGTLDQVIAGQQLTLDAGDVCFIAPNTDHSLSVFDDETLIINILIRVDTFRTVFTGLLNKDDIISDFFSRVLMCNSFYPYIYCRTGIEEKLTSVILDMEQAYSSDMRLKNRLLVTKLEEFFIYLLDAHEYDFVTGSSIGETDRKVLPILRYIQDNFRTVTLSGLAEYFNYSEPYLSRIITMYSGNSFSQIIRGIRLKNAARLIESTDLPITDIGEESGYEDRTYFHRTFKKQYGMTPSQYRQQHLINS